jgi:hypothetical protein
MGVELCLSHRRKKIDLRFFENRVLRRKSGPNREEVTGGQERLDNEELTELIRFTKHY